MSTFFTSLSGLNASSHQLGVTANNIANAGSFAFKRSVASFKDVYAATPSQSSTDSTAHGVAVVGTQQIFTQGSMQSTQNTLNLAIAGQGFFQLYSPITKVSNYTRNGNFYMDKNNIVVNEDGDQLMAANVDSNGKASTGLLTTLQIPPKTVGMYKTSTNVRQTLVLPSGAKAITKTFNPQDPSTYTASNLVDLVDDYGRVRQGRFYYIKTQDPTEADPYSQWKTVLTVDGQIIQPGTRNYTRTDVPPETINEYYMQWSGSGDAKDVILLKTSERPDIGKDAVSVVGQTVYRGDGVKAIEVAQIDPQNNGLIGKPLRLNLIREGFANSGFELSSSLTDPLPGWTVLNQQVKLDGLTKVAGWPTPIDTTKPIASPGDGVSTSGATFETGTTNTAGSTGQSAQLNSNGTISAGFGIMRGPAIFSNDTIELNAKDPVSFDWKASGGADAYDIYAYLLNTDTGETIQLIDQTGAVASENTDWVTVKTTVPKDGNYKFVFVSGSYDANGGTGTGAQLFVDNIKTPQKNPLQSTSLSPLVTYTRELEDKDGILRFNRAGALAPDLTQISYANPYETGTSLKYDLTGTRTVNLAYAVSSSYQDGAPDGLLESLDIATDGLIKGTYSNGAKLSLGKVILANFANPDGLSKKGDAKYQVSAESGQAVFSEAGSNGFGAIRSGTLEMSNVDVTVELTDLILAQRNFQANAKAIETNSQMIRSMADNIR